MLPLCHPFTAIVSGPTGCGKTAWVLRLIDNIREKIEPVPRRIWYYYGEYQHAFNNYASVHFEAGLPQLSDEVFDGSEPSIIVVDDHMSDISHVVAAGCGEHYSMVHSYLRFSGHIVHVPKSALQLAKRAAGLG